MENACQGGGETDDHFDPTVRGAGCQATCQGGVGDDEQAGGEVDSPGDQSDGQTAEHGVCQGLGEADGQGDHVHDESTGQGAVETGKQGTCQLGEEVDGGHGGRKYRMKGDWTAAVLGVGKKELESGFSRV